MEIIVVDDGSTDDPRERAKIVSARVEILVGRKNSEITASLNRILDDAL